MSSPDRQGLVEGSDRDALLRLALHSIRYGLAHGCAIPVDPADYSPALQAQRTSFVTLEKQGALRGCIGSLEAKHPLVVDVAENAFAAAFRDTRFTPLAADELPDLEVHVSVLSAQEGMDISSEQDLLAQLRPGIDGLVLEEGDRRATFLPSVWESLADPRDFVTHLKVKAGWNRSYWSDGIRALRYTADIIGP
jgi:AmmeMemoRadiSam system protein A